MSDLRLKRLIRHELPIYLRRPRPAQRCFLIFAQGRTGTWLLHSLLNAHPQIDCAKEILQQRVRLPVRYVVGYARGYDAPRFGCHVQINQLLTRQLVEPAAFLHALHGRGWQILYVWRRNIVRQSISGLVATQRQEWVTQQPDRLAGQRYHIDGVQLLAWLDRRERHLVLERQLLADLPHLELVYEDDLEDTAAHPATMTRVFEWLGVPPVAVAAGVERLSPPRLADYVANYDEIAALLAGTRYEAYLT